MTSLEALVEQDKDHCCGDTGAPCVRLAAVANLPTRWGDFRIVAFENNVDHKEHVAVVRGDVVNREDVLVRLHSECLTGDVLGSLRCDCRDQLEAALRLLANEEAGVLLYLRQEGRGIGLTNKIRAYALQERGMDTVDANLALGFGEDERDYGVAAHMLRSMGIRSIRLLTNNPRKVDGLRAFGTQVSARVPHSMPPNVHNRAYLATKAGRSGHFIDLEQAEGDER